MLTMLYDFIPVVLFFVAFKLYGIYVATAVGIITTALQVAITGIWQKRLDKKQLITLIVFIIFGGMTLYFHDPIFVKWKPSIIFWIFGLVLLISQFVGSKPLMQRMLEKMLEGKGNATIPVKIWTQLNVAWALFFIMLGTLNLYVIYSFSTDAWVNFKVYGVSGLLFAFCILQTIYIGKYLRDDT